MLMGRGIGNEDTQEGSVRNALEIDELYNSFCVLCVRMNNFEEHPMVSSREV